VSMRTNSCATLIFGLALGFTILMMGFSGAIASEDPSPVSSPGVTGPIELSPALAARCKGIAGSNVPEHQDCVRASHILALMSAELRDAAWAGEMESFLEKWIESLETDGFTFRNVECRKSWCVVEVGSTIGAGDRRGHDLVLDGSEAQKRRIFQALSLFAHDLDDPSIWDAQVLFKRYCGSPKELFDGNDHLAPDFNSLGQTC
jgi:hypothetical protein